MNVVVLALIVAAAGPLDGRRVVVVPKSDDVVDVEHAEDVTAALQARGLVPVGRDERAGVDGVFVDVDVGDREKARGLLQEARARFRDLDLAAAEASGRAAFDEALRLARPEDHLELLVDTLLFIAAVRIAEGPDDAEGLRLLRLAARLEPARVALDPGLHRPSVVAAWAVARQKNADEEESLVVVAPRVVGVDGDGVGAEVVVDGVVRSPVGGLLQLGGGPHLVTLRARGAAKRSRVIDVVAAGTAPITDTLAPADAARRRHEAVLQVRDGDAAAFARLGVLVDASVIVALDSRGRVRAFVDGDVRDVDVAGPDEVTAVASGVIAAFATTKKAPDPPPPPVVVDEPLPAWVVGAAVGATVLAAGVVATVVLVLPGAEVKPPPRTVPGTCCGL